jgi:hypothetical protein
MADQWRWLIVEGLIPLFGASALYLLWGVASRITDDESPPAKFSWTEAADSMGWLYVGLILAIQSALRCWNAPTPQPVLGFGCVMCAIVCLILLLCAMAKRGQKPAWRPPLSMQITSVFLVIAILLAGYRAQGLAPPIRHEAGAVSPSDEPVKAVKERHE